MLLRMGLFMLADKRETSPPFCVLRMVTLCSSWKRSSLVFSMYPRRWLCLGSRAKILTLHGRHKCFVDDSAFHTSFREAPLFVGDTAEVVSPSATSTEFDPT